MEATTSGPNSWQSFHKIKYREEFFFLNFLCKSRVGVLAMLARRAICQAKYLLSAIFSSVELIFEGFLFFLKTDNQNEMKANYWKKNVVHRHVISVSVLLVAKQECLCM